MNTFKLVLVAASILLALTFTISCSDGGDEGGGGGGGSNITETYALRDVTDDSFTYFETYERNRCRDGGNIVKETDERSAEVNYSISNNVLVWEYRWSDDGTLNFAGTSNNLTGTWTRAKNKDASCKTDEDYGYFYCERGYDIVKAEFTASTVKITRDVCNTDEEKDGSEENGWRIKVIDCNTIEGSKGTDKVTIKETETSVSFRYNGKSCSIDFSEPTRAQQESACRKAWNEYGQTDMYWDDYYYDFLYENDNREADFYECLEINGFPADFFEDDDEDDDEDSYGAALSKPLLKQKLAKKR